MARRVTPGGHTRRHEQRRGRLLHADLRSAFQGTQGLHLATAWGFAATFAAPGAAALYEHLLDRLPPYGLFTAPVLLGSIGGAMMLIGPALRSTHQPSNGRLDSSYTTVSHARNSPMSLTSITLPGRQSRAHELHAALYDAILSGELTAGDRLVEEQIAAMASVSRTPVREAIRRLEAEGLVENSASGPVAVTLRSDDLVEMCEVREVLGALATRLAAQGRSEMTILTLEDIIERLRASIEADAPVADLLRLNNAFHETVWDGSGNRYLAGQLRMLRARISLSGPTTLQNKERHPESVSDHMALLDAIRERDGDRAAELASIRFRKAMAIRLAGLRSEPNDRA